MAFVSKVVLVAHASVVALSFGALACGPAFPNRLLENGDAAVLQMPVAVFNQEIDRIMPRTMPAIAVRSLPVDELEYRETVKRLDLGDIDAISRTNGNVSVADLGAYTAIREAMYHHDVARIAWSQSPTSSPPVFVAPPVPDGGSIPREFTLYLTGAMEWYRGATGEAVYAWQRLLDLPPDQRRCRGIWAAFMLGKAMLVARDQARAIGWFQTVRRLAREGADDSLGLAASSLGWEARAELDRRGFGRAIELYLDQLAAGGETAAVNSLLFAARAAWKSEPGELERLVKHPAARKVLVAYALSCGEHGGAAVGRLGGFIAAIERSGIAMVEEADRLGWAAYKAGDMEMAGRLHAVAPRDSVMTVLLGIKLMLRRGEEAKAMEQLAAIVRSFPEAPELRERFDWLRSENDTWELAHEPMGGRLRGELGVLHLARREYVQALDMLLRGGYWQDAAYVAERVLTIVELREYVDKQWGVAEHATVEKHLHERRGTLEMGSAGENIRYLLGRRMVRAGAMGDARAYLPPSLRPALDACANHLRCGRDVATPRARRGEALWKAACIMRYLGMELMGTELDPDWSMYGGLFAEPPMAVTRAATNDIRIAVASADELAHARATVPVPELRFHYRWRATDLAWRAAELMPDESALTAEVLCTAGGWIKIGDPRDADRFYKALVRRCGATTALGRAAAERHWFPDHTVDKERMLKEALGRDF